MTHFGKNEIARYLSCIMIVMAGLSPLSSCVICRSQIETSIGSFDSREAGIRSALRHLAKEIDTCPRAELYRVIWDNPNPKYQSVDRQAIIYDRARKRLGYEHDIYSGISGKTYVVDDNAIRKVAETQGALEDFAEYDEKGK